MTTTRARLIVLGAGLLLALIALVVVALPDGEAADRSAPTQADDAPQVRSGDPAPSPAVTTRHADPANYIAAEHSTDLSRRAEFQLEADRAKDLVAALRAGELGWQPTLIVLDFSELALQAYIKCSSTYLRKPCEYDLEYVIDVKEPGVGEVAFGRAVMDRHYEKDCEQYVKCLVRENVGASIPVPPEVDAPFSHRKTQTDNYPEATLEQFKEMLEIMKKGVAMMEERGPDGELDWEYRLELERSYITLLTLRIAAMGG